MGEGKIKKRAAAAEIGAFAPIAFKARPGISTGYFVVGLAQIVVGILISGTSAFGIVFVPAGGIMIWLSRMFARTVLVEIRGDAVVTRASPRAPALVVPFAAIRRVAASGTAAIDLHLDDRVAKVWVAALSREDAARVRDEVEKGRARAGAAGRADAAPAEPGVVDKN